ncbi:Thioredoxin [Seminavis robusta]|uniref:Thioredoxin n=1 Tax=Seminavis robusta TaxID=568900 RepID=A0A9N8H1K4_9STRA|nr:Thioredoxin [Seminavis robusta]|eukprot:Sro18_g013170.1 Thioredoxin (201) ;mRNA; f:172937-173539
MTDLPMECTDGICIAPSATKAAAAETEDLKNNNGHNPEAETGGKGDQAVANNVDNQEKHDAPRKSQPTVIKKVYTQQDLDGLLGEASSSFKDVMVVEFVTTWCGACKGIAPLWEELASLHSADVQCAQVVCDKNKETKKLAQAQGIKSYPVFKVYDTQSGNMTQTWNGADRGKLEKVFDNMSGGKGGGKKGGGKKKKNRR